VRTQAARPHGVRLAFASICAAAMRRLPTGVEPVNESARVRGSASSGALGGRRRPIAAAKVHGVAKTQIPTGARETAIIRRASGDRASDPGGRVASPANESEYSAASATWHPRDVLRRGVSDAGDGRLGQRVELRGRVHPPAPTSTSTLISEPFGSISLSKPPVTVSSTATREVTTRSTGKAPLATSATIRGQS
jgi:hypothetical protein